MRERRPIAFRIVTRILLLNGLIVFLPVASMLLLDTYEQQLLDALERNLVQQGRVLSAALAVMPHFDAESASSLLRALRGRHEARLRILDQDGTLLADSSTLDDTNPPAGTDATAASRPTGGTGTTTGAAPSADSGPSSGAVASTDEDTDPREAILYRVASFPVRVLRELGRAPASPLPSADFYTRASYASGSEVQAALAGRYGATTRVSAGGQISVTLYSALPIQRDGQVVGAVLVSQSTFRILQDLYQIRLDVFTVFLWCLAASIILSTFLSLTIARPIAMLQQRAREAVDERGRLRGPLPPQRRHDEIGDLSRSLSELTEQIDRYTRGLEGFAADASHELKNPLASIAANCELALETADDARRRQFLMRARSDVKRAESIIAAIRELSQIDARTDSPGRCAIVTELAAVSEELSGRIGGAVRFEAADDLPESLDVALPPERVYQLIENVVRNAQSFSPPGSSITIRAGMRTKGRLRIDVSDEGPGFEEPERVFDRFYSARASRDGHLGLGLSIVKAIAESIGGTVQASNPAEGGAQVSIDLPCGKG